MQGLLASKARVHDRHTPEADEKAKRTAAEQAAQSDANIPVQSLSSPAFKLEPAPQNIDQVLPEHPNQSTASRLLARKRAQRDRKDPGNNIN
jgi:hypothetical protein